MAAIYLTESDVRRLVDMPVAVETVEEAFRQLATGGADNQPRRRVRAKGIILHSMSAAAEYLGRVGWKQYTTTRHGARFLVGIYAADSGELEALIEAEWLGRLRTGAATGVAVKYLAAADASEMGMIGTGRQAETQLAAVAAVRPLRRAVIFSRDKDRRSAFATKMSDQLKLEVVAADSAQAAMEDMPIVVTATTSRTPVLEAEWLDPNALVCCIGSNAVGRVEIDARVVGQAANIVCDSVEACQVEAAELLAATESGDFQWNMAIELGDVVLGDVVTQKQTLAATGMKIFKSVGLAVEDVALGNQVLELAKAAGAGSALPI